MDDTEIMTDALFELTISPLLAPAIVIRQRIFNGYAVAPNTLATDCARYFLQLLSIAPRDGLNNSEHDIETHSKLDVAAERLSWLAAADVKYFIIPGATREHDVLVNAKYDGYGVAEVAAKAEAVSSVEEDRNDNFILIQSSTIDDAYLYDEDEI